jgi:hypothetical protein
MVTVRGRVLRALWTRSSRTRSAWAANGRWLGPRRWASSCPTLCAAGYFEPVGNISFFLFPFRIQMKFNSSFMVGLNIFNSVQTWKLDELLQVLNSGEGSELCFQIQVNLVKPFLK